MRNLIILILILISNFCFSQITEVKTDGSYLRIYNDRGNYTGTSIYVGTSYKLDGYNNQFIVISDRNYANIYNMKGKYTGISIYLGSSKKVKRVSESNILIQDGHYTRYYNFRGNYTHSTYDN
jgi:hypothetical protein